MKIILSSLVAGHMHALAKFLYKKDLLARMISSYPSWKLNKQKMPVESKIIYSFPWFVTPYMFLHRINMLPAFLEKNLSRGSHFFHDNYAKRNLINADIFHGLSCHNLQAGRQAKRMGMRYVCDHGSSHIVFQKEIIEEECNLMGVKNISGGLTDERVIETEQLEYLESDHIFVASSFSKDTFIKKGFSSKKISVIPYGVDLSEFYPATKEIDKKFRVIYLGALSIRKGIHYLVEAFKSANIKNSELILIGKKCIETDKLISNKNFDKRIKLTGILSRNQILKLLSMSSVFVLPSIEDGYGLVLLEAMACGLPVIATVNTGGPDCIVDGVNGFNVPIRSSISIKEKLIYLYENPEERKWMAENALASVSKANGWNEYGEKVLDVYRRILVK